jgi:predicted outer membrane repeat protein
MILRFWSDFYGVSEPTPSKQQLYTSNQTRSVSSVYILDCLFNGCTSTDNGGALYCNTSVIYLLVESSSFFSCKTSGIGGAIYFVNTNNGQSVLHKVCGNDCYSTTSGNNYQFVYIKVYNGATNKNYLNFSSITRCISDNWYTLRLDSGIVHLPSVNISMNKCKYCPIFYTIPFQDSSYVTCTSSYSSFTDNQATIYICIRFFCSDAKFEIKSCNILRNSQVSSDYAIISPEGNLMIEDSCILGNTATYIFHAGSGKITLSNCTINKTTSVGSFTIQNTATKSFIHALNHISTQNCFVEYDAIGALTPIIPPSPSKQIQCNTCKKLLCQIQLIDIVSLHNILIFNFIHPYSSDDSLH